jgi:hypothetical protein
MSIISRIFHSYREALHHSQQRYEDAYMVNAAGARQFYDDFLNQLFIRYGEAFSQPHTLNRTIQRIEQHFERRDIHFVAIDGTCSRDPFNDFMVFFAAAYGVKGCVHIEPRPARLRYERWSMDKDVSLVAYVPVPYAEAGDITDSGYQEEFTVDDTEKINLSSIHSRLMQLGEIYLAYEMARSSVIDGPKLILMDMSLSSVLMSTDVGMRYIHLWGSSIGGQTLTKRDGLVVYAHPVNVELSVPSTKKYRRWAHLVGVFTNNGGRPVELDALSTGTGVSRGDWGMSLQEPNARDLMTVENNRACPLFDVRASWLDSIRLFENFCDKLFHQRDPEALIYEHREGQTARKRWMSPEDISFLTAIGIRALIETCWERGIMLLSVAKDSSTRYFSRHYLGIMRHIGHFPAVDVGSLPWTDRALLESIACQLEDLTAPWAVTEFDSAFMTLHLEDPGTGTHRISGMRGDVVNPERIFARSLAQFFHVRKKPTPLMGHVVFVDRLIDPRWDRLADNSPTITDPELGSIAPMYFGMNDRPNHGQTVAIWLLSTLTRNLFPEVIGYPDPLHKADWGAKTVKRRVDRLIQSSETAFRARPLSRLFRTIRDAQRR